MCDLHHVSPAPGPVWCVSRQTCKAHRFRLASSALQLRHFLSAGFESESGRRLIQDSGVACDKPAPASTIDKERDPMSKHKTTDRRATSTQRHGAKRSRSRGRSAGPARCSPQARLGRGRPRPRDDIADPALAQHSPAGQLAGGRLGRSRSKQDSVGRHTLALSCPRKRASRATAHRLPWTPAFAGVTNSNVAPSPNPA